MAKIAVEFEARASEGQLRKRPARRLLAQGAGWSVSDVMCGAGPRDRVFEEHHGQPGLAIVLQGSFQYRSRGGRALMTPGALLLGNAGQYFECGHEHAVGDRCLSFGYEPKYFDRLVADAGGNAEFRALRVPPTRELAPVIARASGMLARCGDAEDAKANTDLWEEIGIELAARALNLPSDGQPVRESLPAAEARATRVVRMIENSPDSEHSLTVLAHEARLSRYHFLRIFEQVTGLTPHRYILRTRLRRAATRLSTEAGNVLEIALDAGFGDASNFTRAFHAEFGMNPSAYRKAAALRGTI